MSYKVVVFAVKDQTDKTKGSVVKLHTELYGPDDLLEHRDISQCRKSRDVLNLELKVKLNVFFSVCGMGRSLRG